MMRKYVIVKENVVKRVIVCDDSTRVDLAPDETIHKADTLKIKAGDFFFVESAKQSQEVEPVVVLPVGVNKKTKWQKFKDFFRGK